ncbi:adiponectin receptor protein-like [Oppia nitens]|uniref:adiponectin receptor protein-like n=1 Tax=Oppia nitens TaxID=1686743 RepID=UPI0023DAB824|nr:adiponectin receptor protein-like [Oppia nitens]
MNNLKYRQKSSYETSTTSPTVDPNVQHWTTVVYDSLPKFLRDNNYIRGQHRPVLPSFRLCFGSIFRIHSETGNIWTHLVGFVVFVIISLSLLAIGPHKHTLLPMDKLMLGVYFTGALVCHLLSTVYHTCKCHSPGVCHVFHALDFCGISLQIICSMIPCFYYGFYTQYMKWFYIYTGAGTTLFCVALTISLYPKFATPVYKPLRALVFLVFGLSNVVPGLHLYYILEPQFMYCWSLVVLQGMVYVLGAVIYALRIPEKYFPGKCDLWPQSHQIFHSLVTIGALIHFRSIYRMIYLRQI